ncbi:conserved domain protein [Streptococcus infantis SK1076]|uniref:Conserved domain protein n=1 Tax=Streptococcus infantis SK1076 TaxID=1005705 RepID=F5W1L8_9STRE|nr:conserved domain protein [Streptococcus infantis SK1076]
MIDFFPVNFHKFLQKYNDYFISFPFYHFIPFVFNCLPFLEVDFSLF